MLQKVRKLSNKLFGDDKHVIKDEGGSSHGSRSERSSNNRDSRSSLADTIHPPKHSEDFLAPKSFSKSKDPTNGAGIPISPNSVQHTHGTTVTHARSKATPAASAFLNSEAIAGSSTAHVLPSVQVNAQASGRLGHQPPSPAGVAGSPVASTGTRRKSMPAAINMALRQAESKAHIDEIINSGGQKQMVFGQYFGGSKAEVGGTGATAEASRLKKQSQVAAASGRPAGTDKVIGTVSEDAPSNGTATHAPTKRVNNVEHPSVGDDAEARAAHMASNDNDPPKNKILSMAASLPNRMARKHWSLSDYSIVRKLYKGYASTVYQATCKKSLEQVALKIYHMQNLCELNHYQVFREIRVHASLQHQNIITIYCTFQEGNDIVLVQEYAEGGDLYRLLYKNGGRLSERQAVEMVLAPFLLAMHYLHTRGIMHRDIKPENVLFTEHRVLKLADFGLAIDLNEERAVTRAGTLDYMAPEVLRCPPKNLPQENKTNKSLQYTNSVDSWAVGVFAYELIVGVAPFAGKSQLDCVDRIIHSTAEFPEKTSELAKSFITAALKKHPDDRPTIMEMLHHPWIHAYKRRTSTLVPAAIRRHSSALVIPNYAPQPPVMQSGPSVCNPQGVPLDKMSPEQVEEELRKLQNGKGMHSSHDQDVHTLGGSNNSLHSSRLAMHSHV